MTGIMGNELGEITIENEVLAKVAGLKAVECYGIVGMAMVNVTGGIAKLLKRESLTKGILVRVEENAISIDLHVIVEYGVNIRAVTDNLISTVRYELETFSGLKVAAVDVFVEGVRVDE
ncbi:Asp23/Gls24 family envelope stress response protein [Anaerotalea alkaliphila]|uniref:Asp23/Gls24 family envelope stress response protein n=1 Tax=Anaerotalea alkaliphila TaxID=2662126 RepID=A0A7X5HUY2_9FIRM|nr:Asp23/Gls24 family envelope stress response protein [Anaerotalea alkaliphila]NDL66881.1 Asp23/Gls24 family envelope stress response protein [Anaerotalea alkaliphila]